MNPKRPPYLATHAPDCDMDEDCTCGVGLDVSREEIQAARAIASPEELLAELGGEARPLAGFLEEHATKGATVVEVEGARAEDHEVDRFLEGVRWSDAQIRALTKLLGRDVVDSGSLSLADVHRLRSAGYRVETAHGGVVIRPPSGSRRARRAKASRAKRAKTSRKRR